MKRVYAGLLLILIYGCSNQPVLTNYDPLTQARIRVYKGPNVYISQPVTSGRRYFDAASPSLPNHTIGMPIPKNAYQDTLSSFAGNFKYIPYREYSVPANKELTVVSFELGSNASTIGNAVIQGPALTICNQTEIRFTPQPGKDYDFTVIPIPFQGPECKLSLREFVTENGELTAVSIPYTIIYSGPLIHQPHGGGQ